MLVNNDRLPMLYEPPTPPSELPTEAVDTLDDYSPELIITWYRQSPHDWFRVNYSDPNTGFHAGWHQDEDHLDLGRAHFQYSTDEEEDRWEITFEHETLSLILWEIIEELLEDILPTYQ